MHKVAFGLAIAGLLAVMLPAIAQDGPVATECAADIQKYCADKGHGNRQTRSCLEDHYKKVSAKCRKALDNTGGRRWR
jgi:hypothetical protein